MRHIGPLSAALAMMLASGIAWAADPVDTGDAIPADARYACPMETHPNQENPQDRGPYFAASPGECPRCGMKLVPIDELSWARSRRAAEGAEVAYTCSMHQQVFSRTPGKCPRCGDSLEPFKVMYTCPSPKHAALVFVRPGTCPKDGRKLVPFRGVWLSEKMAADNAPPRPELADGALYRCPTHPLVHSDRPGHCPICAGELQREKAPATQETSPVPSDAKYACPMQSCHYFAAEPGRCPKCGMAIKPIEEVAWAAALLKEKATPPASGNYVCPMHREERADQPGRCPTCGMRLVPVDEIPEPKTAPEAVQVQMNHLMEHYLELQQRFAADRTKGAAQQALGLIAACDEIETLLNKPGLDFPDAFRSALSKLREAALKLRGEDLAESRAVFVQLSAALRTMVEQVRPSRKKYGHIYIFHCPMANGDWLQASKEIKNPYYGFEMLKCGALVSTL